MTPLAVNTAQDAAIVHPFDRPLKVAAGPGTGKTHLLARRYLHLLKEHNLQPRQILALTFTNRAAAEMRERVTRYALQEQLVPSALDLSDSRIGTFHSVSLRLLQENPLAAGLPSGIAAIDEVERRRLRAELRRRLLNGELGDAEWRPGDALLLDLAEDAFWRGAWETIDRLQDLLVTPSEFMDGALARTARRQDQVETMLAAEKLANARRAFLQQARDDYAHLSEIAAVVALLYRAYQAELRDRGALDFPGQIMAAYHLLTANAAVQARYRAQFRHILVDEVQDTSGAQMTLVAALAAPELANVTVIGDGKQSIYGWRGARPENLAGFPLDGGDGAYTLQRNYRSYQEIVDVAAHALQPLAQRGRVQPVELELIAEQGSAGRPLVTLAGPTGELAASQARQHEAGYLAARVAALLDEGYRGEEIVVLMRSVALAGPYAEALRRRGIPTLVIGGKGFYGRPEVRDALALLRAASDPLDTPALVRVMQGPLCGLSDAAVAAVARHGGQGPLYEGLARAETLPFSVPDRDEVVRRAAALVALLDRVGRRLEGLPLPDLLRDALQESGYLDYARTRPDVERERVLANLEKVRRAARLYAEAHPLDTVAAFARRLCYVFDEEIGESEESVDAGPDVVRFMTVHQAKGLEFRAVLVANAMPSSYRLANPPAMTYDEQEGFLLLKRRDPAGLEVRDAADLAEYKERQKERYLEEERYVWYVALTRARERLILTTSRRLDRGLNRGQQWPLQELYREVCPHPPTPSPSRGRGGATCSSLPSSGRGVGGEGRLAHAVTVESIDVDASGAAPRAESALPPLAEALERVRAAAALVAREDPPVVPALPGPVTLSYSALRTYLACPRRYQLQHALRLPAVPAALRAPRADGAPEYDPLVLGTAVHAALERYPGGPGAAARPARRDLVAAFLGSCRAQGLDAQAIETVYRPRGEAMLDLYLERVVGAGQVQRVYAELAVRQLMRDGAVPVYLVGRIDRVDLDAQAGWRLIDYKTHRALAPADLEAAAVQLRLYKAAWQAGAAAALEQPADSQSSDPALYVYEAASGALHEVDGGPRALEAAVHLLCDVAGKVAVGDFAVPPGYEPPCASCPFGGPYGLCPDRRNRHEEGNPDAALAGEVYGARRYDHGATPGQYPMLGPHELGAQQGPIPSLDAATDGGELTAPCFLCAPGERCARAHLSGTLREARVWHEEHGARVQALLRDGGREVWLELAPPWQSLGPTLQEILAAGLTVRLAAHHLAHGISAQGIGARPGYRATERSLVVLDPDTLVDATSIANAAYCARRSLIDELCGRGGTAAMAEGSAIHVAFARGLLRGEPGLAHLDGALRGAAAGLALLADGDDAASTRERAEGHLRRMDEWLAAHQPAGRVRAEALLLSPGLGLRGRADAIVDPDGAPTVLDLKTGRSEGAEPREAHALQMAAYDLLLRERGRVPAAGWLLYSGNPAGDVGRRVPVAHAEHVRVLRLRNELAAITLLGRAPLSPYSRRCASCPVIARCHELSFLNGETAYALNRGEQEVRARLTEADARFFRHYNALLRLEGRAAAASVQSLWRETAAQRIARGNAVDVADARRQVETLAEGEELWRFTWADGGPQGTQLREGDVVLVGDGDPIMGEAEQGVVERSGAGELVLRLRGALAREPRLVDRYAVDSGWLRGLRTLWSWLSRPDHQRRLVDGSALPRLDVVTPVSVPQANEQQQRAVALALAARDYLLVQGPPGAGKTSTIAAMVRALRTQGRRVLLASFTNRAVDTMLGALSTDDARVAVRLGGAGATDERLRHTLLLRQAVLTGATEPDEIAALLRAAPIVAGTTATLAAAGYDDQRFDVAIVDEASQLTVPGVLAALRLATRFVLVGDDRQLPPVVQSAEATQIEDGLDTTLFTVLRRRLEASSQTDCLVMLEQQYRMNDTICAFPSAEWYGGKLRAGTEAVARGRLALALAAAPPYLRNALDPARPVVFLDVAPLGAAGTLGVTRTSEAEARQVSELCAALVAGGVPEREIGVVAPYRAQVALIGRRLHAAGLGGIVTDTVDRFQGSERAVMLLSLVGGAGQVGHLLHDERRLNVALTRARHKLILLGHAAELRAVPLYARLLDAVEALPHASGQRPWPAPPGPE